MYNTYKYRRWHEFIQNLFYLAMKKKKTVTTKKDIDKDFRIPYTNRSLRGYKEQILKF